METKQVIVWRQDLQNVPLGKKMTQAAHAAHLFLTEQVRLEFEGENPQICPNLDGFAYGELAAGKVTIRLTQAQMDWINGNYRKITVFVRSEEELMTIYNKAKELNIPVHIVTDNGLTVFDKPTVTCLAIGPDESNKIDQVTGENGPLGKLKLL